MRITHIDEFSGEGCGRDYGTYEGFRIATDEGLITLGVSDQQDCCESWGHFASEDDLKSFIGAIVHEVKVTDTALKTHQVKDLYLEDGGIMFVTLETDRGPLQFAVYNEHNGYYGHDAFVEAPGLSKSETL